MPDNILKKRDAYVIANLYNFFPRNDMRFEEVRDPDGPDWGFFANKSNRVVCHIKFESDDFPNDF